MLDTVQATPDDTAAILRRLDQIIDRRQLHAEDYVSVRALLTACDWEIRVDERLGPVSGWAVLAGPATSHLVRVNAYLSRQWQRVVEAWAFMAQVRRGTGVHVCYPWMLDAPPGATLASLDAVARLLIPSHALAAYDDATIVVRCDVPAHLVAVRRFNAESGAPKPLRDVVRAARVS